MAVANARPGDAIVLADGVYLIDRKIVASASGTSDAPITVRASRPTGAHLRSAALIAFEVTGSYWHFSDLDVTGVCARDTECEHAFHVVGHSTGFVLQSSRLADFNAHIKVNANDAHEMPARGEIVGSELLDSHPRHTDNPVAPINIDNATAWTVRANLIHDFQKDGTGEGSYGAFVKGGSQAPVIERNLVLCARDAAPRGHMVGLSFGAHGMDAKLCPPHWDAWQGLKSPPSILCRAPAPPPGGIGRHHAQQHRAQLQRRWDLPLSRRPVGDIVQHAGSHRGYRVPFSVFDRCRAGQSDDGEDQRDTGRQSG